ncbi:MAG TPA: radical SAM protein [Myxococcota bacterium]|nr:radical SAM protein [Myxococcota bacterium]HRY91992.1 radical SAM protein [Myxococcota bacterium]HSA23274.1 radical SAM protein [Myxococcota bacterium]
MEIRRKLELLTGQADVEAEGEAQAADRGSAQGGFIYRAVHPSGRPVAMLKTLLDNACTGDCGYCAQRAGRDTCRTRFAPEELARLFAELVRAGRAEALFLSSGLGSDPIRTMDRMLAAVELVRTRHAFQGFVHLKILPGVERSQVVRAAALADRLSINLEAPTPARLRALSGGKQLSADILTRVGWIADEVRARRGRARGHTTQLVVGPAGETDAELLGAAARMYRRHGASRVYYSAFRPVPGTPLEDRPAAPARRQLRLYQADFLLRRYGFEEDDMALDPAGNLPLDEDPKTAWARRHPERFPLEVNRADREELLQVPGLGPLAVERILAARRASPIRSLEDLRRLSLRAERAAPFLLFEGRPAMRQLRLALAS